MKVIDKDAIGVEISWCFGDGRADAVTIPRDEFNSLLVECGFGRHVGNTLTANAALKRAVQMAGKTRGYMVREFVVPNPDTPLAFGVYKTEPGDEHGDDFKVVGRVRVAANTIKAAPPQNSVHFDDVGAETIARGIASKARALLNTVVNSDISEALVGIGRRELAWISRRPHSGGVYFASISGALERFVDLLFRVRRMTELNASDCFYPQVMEVYPKPLSLDMWTTATQTHYSLMTDKLVTSLRAVREGSKMQRKTMVARADECSRLIAAAEMHRDLLAGQSEKVAEELRRIDGVFRELIRNGLEDTEAMFDKFFEAMKDA